MLDLTPILQAVIGLIAVLISVYLVPWLKSKLSTDKQETLAWWIDFAVSAAEQIFTGAGQGEEKLAYVAAFLKSKGYSVDVDDVSDAVRVMIESAVYALNN